MLAPVSIGTETTASLIYPASRVALYTLKPTIGIVSQEGIAPIFSIFDAAGPMTKSVMDLAYLMDVIVDPTKSRVPSGGYKTVLSSSWVDLKVGVLDPADWGAFEARTKPDPHATKQMVRPSGLLI